MHSVLHVYNGAVLLFAFSFFFFVELVKFTQIRALACVFSFVVSKYELYCSTIFIYIHVTLVPNQSREVKQY